MSYQYIPSSRRLTEAQLRLPFFKYALESLTSISQNREHVLPRLHMHASGRRVRVEIHRAIEQLAESLLIRLDLATDTLGWADEKGQMRISNQTQLAADAGITPQQLSRLFAFLEAAGYLKRRIKALTKRQSKYLWTVRTQTTITFTPLFFRHLGRSVYRAYCQAQKWSLKKRKKLDVKAQMQAREKAIDEALKRSNALKRKNFEAWKRQQTELKARQAEFAANARFAAVLHEVAIDSDFIGAGKPPNEIRIEAERRLKLRLTQ